MAKPQEQTDQTAPLAGEILATGGRRKGTISCLYKMRTHTATNWRTHALENNIHERAAVLDDARQQPADTPFN